MGEGKIPEACHIPKFVLGLPKIPTMLSTHNLVIQIILQFIRTLLPLMQMSKLHYTTVHPQIPKIHLPLIQIILHPTNSHIPSRVLLSIVQRAVEQPITPSYLSSSSFTISKSPPELPSSNAKLPDKLISQKSSSRSEQSSLSIDASPTRKL